METPRAAFGAGERVTFPEGVTDGFRRFAEAGDSGTVIHYWLLPLYDYEYYTVINDIERVEGKQKFTCLPQHLVAEE